MNNTKTIFDYKEYVKFLNNLYFNKIFSKINVTNDGSSLNINIEKTGQKYKYIYENETIKKFFNDWLEPNIIFSDMVSSSSNYQLFVCSAIQELILSAENKLNKGEELIHKFYIPKKSGGKREIIAPCEEIKGPLQTLNKILQKAYDFKNEDFQVAYKIGKNVVDNATMHAENQRIFKIDLKDFFPSCKESYVDDKISFLFKNNFPNKDFIKKKVLDLIIYDGGLYIGNPVSGTLANAIISEPVKYIKNICKKCDMEFSVYADDMTFSSNKFIKKNFIVNMFNKAFAYYNMNCDFKLNVKKCYGLSKSKRFITGVVLNDSNKLTCKRNKYLRIRQTLHQLHYGDTSHIVEPSEIGSKDKTKYWTWNQFKGNIAYALMVDESGKLKTILKKYKSEIQKYNIVSKRVIEELGI